MTTPISVGPTSLDLPAWVQAVGSILAIAAAIVISKREDRLREKARLAERDIELDREVAARARFLQMIALQLDKAIEAADPEEESNQYRVDQEAVPPEGWEHWGNTILSRFFRESVGRLERISQIPLSLWPDVEASFIFADGFLRVKDRISWLKEQARVPRLTDPEHARSYWINEIMPELINIRWSMASPFWQFVSIRDQAVDEARKRGLDVRYANRGFIEAEEQRLKDDFYHNECVSRTQREDLLGEEVLDHDDLWWEVHLQKRIKGVG